MKKILFLIAFTLCTFVANSQNIVPQPNYMNLSSERMVIPSDAAIGYYDKELKPAAEYLAGILRPSTGYKFKIYKDRTCDLQLAIDGKLSQGSYKLIVVGESYEKQIIIYGADYRGVIAGIQTLRQLFPAEIESRSVVSGVEWSVPYGDIEDSPRFDYRGLELDVSRHFYTKQEIKEMLDVMALYKLNKFHWHLTDDQGWRIEIKKYPKLTDNGAWRKYNNHDLGCNATADKNQDEDMRVPTDRQKVVNGESLYGGFYTQKDIREIVEYARVRGIDIIPEIDMPGHMLAAEQNYDGISCFDITGWGQVFSSPLCPGKDKTLAFCKDVLDEVTALFPYNYFHIGGDEVEKINWKKCPDCQARIKEHGLKSEEELQSWFIHEMEKYLNSKGKRMIGWNEIIEGGLSDTSTIMWWGSWVKDVPEVTTSHGNDLIFTPNDYFYLDYDEKPAAVQKIYNFDATAGLPEAQQKHLLGVQGNIWCEWIPTMNRVWYMTSNRMLAIAELGWSNTEPKNFYEFQDRAFAQYERFRIMDVDYKLAPLSGFMQKNVFTDKGVYDIVCKDPGVQVRYTADGTMPDENSPLVEQPFVVKESQNVIFRTFRCDGKKGDAVQAQFVKENYAPAVNFKPQANGLTAAWYDYAGADLNEIDKAKFNGRYNIDGVGIPVEAKGNIGLVIDGYIYIPQDGIYTFEQTSDDGSDLDIDGDKVINMNREQGPTTEYGQKALKKGYHQLRARYFDHNGGSLKLVVKDAQGNILEPGNLYFK